MNPNDPNNPGAGIPQAGGPPMDNNYGDYGPQPAVASQPYIPSQPPPPVPAPTAADNLQPYQPATPSPLPPAQPLQPFPTQPQTVAPEYYQAPAQVGTTPAMTGTQPVAHPLKSNPNSTQNTLQIAEIRDGIVIMNDGSYRSVVMVKSINFDLMSPQEREAVEYSYQGFLNSLYFPVQIFIRSQKVDLQPYLEKLDKIRTEHESMLLALPMEYYI